jgi:hypothetical protein
MSPRYEGKRTVRTKDEAVVGGEALGLVDGECVAVVQTAGGQVRTAHGQETGVSVHGEHAPVRVDVGDPAALSVE